ncbi:MAG: hypothetical protein U0325_01600 [Polyangiales bacterium]
MTRPTVCLALALGACVSTPPPVPPPAPVAPAPRRRERVAAPQRAPGVRGLVEEFRALREVPDDVTTVPEAARGPLRALRQGLRSWLLDAVREAGRVPPRVQLRAVLDEAELTVARAGEELNWGTVTRIDVVAPSESFTAVIVGLRLSCTSDDALYVFDGARLVLELAQDSWTSLTDARADLRVTQSRAGRNDGALMVSSRAQRCASRWQSVRFEGLMPGTDPAHPMPRWDLRHGVDVTGECGGFDEATLGIALSRNGFELMGCEPSTGEGEPRPTRARYAFTHGGIEPAAGVTSRRSRRR